MTIIETTGHAVDVNANPSGVRAVKGQNLMHASREWASRPADQAVFTMDDLLARTRTVQATSRSMANVPWSELQVLPHANGNDLCLTRGTGAARFSHWSLGQLCNLPSNDGSGSIASQAFLGKLSPALAAQVLNERLQAGIARKASAQLLFGRPNPDTLNLRCITTDKYHRIYDHEIIDRLAGLTSRSTWQGAEAFRTATGKAAHAWGEVKPLPLAWLSDRDLFCVLVDYEGSVMVDGTQYARFCMLSHSEVGDGALWLMWGLFSFACSNFIMWGCKNVYEVNLRHSKGLAERWNEIGTQIATPSLTRDGASELKRGILAARNTVISDDLEQLTAIVKAATKLPESLIVDAHNRAVATPAYGNPASVWGMVQGLTEASQHAATNTDRRVAIDVAAAKLMSLVGKL